MSVVDDGSAGSGLVARVKGILLSPTPEWEKIDKETATIGGLFTGYACILAAIPAVAGLIGGQVFGHGAFGFSYKPSLVAGLTTAVLSYVGSLLMTFVLGMVIEALAPNFGAEKNRVQAFKVAVYACTAGWVAGAAQIIPALGIIALLGGLYGCWLMYLGLPKVMKAPADKATGYTVVTIIVAIVVSVVISLVTGAIGGMATLGSLGSMSHADKGGTVEVNGRKFDMGRLEEAGKRAEALSKNPGKAVAPDTLKGMLPDNVAGYSRASVETSSSGSGDVQIGVATGKYERGDTSFELAVTDLGPMGAMAALASGMGAQQSKETADGYEKVSTVDGRLTSEEWNRQSKSGKYSVVIADRFAVAANGTVDSIDDLKQAVRAVDAGRLESLAR